MARFTVTGTETVDPKSRRGFLFTLTSEDDQGGVTSDPAYFYPIPSDAKEEILQKVRTLAHPMLSTIRGFTSYAGGRFAVTEYKEGDLLSEFRHRLSPEELCEIISSMADGMESFHREGLAYGGLASYDIRMTPSGLLLPPPICEATTEAIAADFASAGGIFFELLTGQEYRIGTVVGLDIIPSYISNASPEFAEMITRSTAGKIYHAADLKAMLGKNGSFRGKKEHEAGKKRIFTESRKAAEATASAEYAGSKASSRKVVKPAGEGSKKKLVVAITAVCVILVVAIVGITLKHNKTDAQPTYDDYILSAAKEISAGKYDAAREDLDKATALDDSYLAAYYYEALSYYKQGDYSGTEEYIRDEILQNTFSLRSGEVNLPQNIYYIYGLSAYALGDYETAYTELMAAKDKGYDADSVWKHLVECAVKLENNTLVKELMGEDQAGSTGSEYLTAVSFAENGDYSSAAESYFTVAKSTEITLLQEYCITRGLQALEVGNDTNALITACEEQLNSDLSSTLKLNVLKMRSDALKKQATTTAEAEDYTLARDSYLELEAEAPTGWEGFTELYYSLGECELALGNNVEAAEYLRRVADIGDEVWSPKANDLLDQYFAE